ncbi:hypothetical protein PSN45_004056 [Yamadazyma tenuis]|uniref:uncharacterized protein n=1 Tax=Candida tenuis TaxID=2315449 RepID=UPI0027A2C018|nr:hypothetical protein PSN45_004056 [Yamadazyma tenuis]
MTVKKQQSIISITELTRINEYHRYYGAISSESEESEEDFSLESIVPKAHTTQTTWFGCISMLGVTFSDISTSPLYSFNTMCTFHNHEREDIYGSVSVIFYLFLVIVLVKYLLVVVYVGSYRGKGGHIAVLAKIASVKYNWIIKLICFIGCSLVLSNAVLNPTTSVLSAVEGIKIACPGFGYMYLGVCILLVMLMLQRFKSATIVTSMISPIIFVWLICLAFIGVYNILMEPQIVQAFNPIFTYRFVGKYGIRCLSSAFLTVTGAETLFTDFQTVQKLVNSHKVFIPFINYILMLGPIAAALVFRDTTRITYAYSLAIAMDFIITTILVEITLVIVYQSKFAAIGFAVFIPLEIAIITANLCNFLQGGWFTIVISILFLANMLTYNRLT